MAMTLEELMNTPFQKEISEGKHRAKLSSAPILIKDAKNPANSYLEMHFNIDAECTYRRNQFARDVSIMLSHLRRQLGKSDETINPIPFLADLAASGTEFDIWFSYPTVMTQRGPQRTQNVRFIEPIAAQPSESSTDDSAALEEIAG